MKYFAQASSPWFQIHLFELGENSNKVYEITSEYALKLYKGLCKPKQFILVAVPNHQNGTLVRGKGFSIWGEKDTTNAECFRRRLAGTLENTVLNKRIADGGLEND